MSEAKPPSLDGMSDKSATDGRFLPGNRAGRGNPHSKAVNRLRSKMLACVSEDDLRAVTAKLIEMAKLGSLPAIKLFFERVLGKPTSGSSVGIPSGQQAEVPQSDAARLEARKVAFQARFLKTEVAEQDAVPKDPRLDGPVTAKNLEERRAALQGLLDERMRRGPEVQS